VLDNIGEHVAQNADEQTAGECVQPMQHPRDDWPVGRRRTELKLEGFNQYVEPYAIFWCELEVVHRPLHAKYDSLKRAMLGDRDGWKFWVDLLRQQFERKVHGTINLTRTERARQIDTEGGLTL
jgi:hypothetical protein